MYVCPMHSEVRQDKPGHCPKCGMVLVVEGKENINQSEQKNSYTPLIIIIALIFVTTLVISMRDSLNGLFTFPKTISYFMIGFFLVFSGFKLMDLKGFAEGYSTYDILAKRWFTYGYLYPFVEMFFGLSMILNPSSKLLLLAEFLVMTFSGLGVLIKLLKHEKFQCACLGTFLKVPLTKVTLVEDFGMALLALLLLIIGK